MSSAFDDCPEWIQKLIREFGEWNLKGAAKTIWNDKEFDAQFSGVHWPEKW